MEEQICFNAHSDRMIYGVSSEENDEMVVEISGYDMQTKFNMDRINSLDDAESACQALADVIFKSLFENLLEENIKLKNKRYQK